MGNSLSQDWVMLLKARVFWNVFISIYGLAGRWGRGWLLGLCNISGFSSWAMAFQFLFVLTALSGNRIRGYQKSIVLPLISHVLILWTGSLPCTKTHLWMKVAFCKRLLLSGSKGQHILSVPPHITKYVILESSPNLWDRFLKGMGKKKCPSLVVWKQKPLNTTL